LKRIGEMIGPMVGLLRAERYSDRHLCHYGGATTPNETPVYDEHTCAGACRRYSGIHPGAARADDQHIGIKLSHDGHQPRFLCYDFMPYGNSQCHS
jgi:hypothetical protein